MVFLGEELPPYPAPRGSFIIIIIIMIKKVEVIPEIPF